MPKLQDLRDLLRHEIGDLLSAEEQIAAALPGMISKATHPRLKAALEEHLTVTQAQKERIEGVQKTLEGRNDEGQEKGLLKRLFATGKQRCRGTAGIIEEGERLLAEGLDPEVMDAAIIACAQKIEHYEICGYGTARAFAQELGLTDIAAALQQTLDEEHAANDLLTQLAYGGINRSAESGGSENSYAEPSTEALNQKTKLEAPAATSPEQAGNGASARKRSAGATTAARKSPEGDTGTPASGARKSAAAKRATPTKGAAPKKRAAKATDAS